LEAFPYDFLQHIGPGSSQDDFASPVEFRMTCP
jgi:hypothetical protein